MIAVLNFQIIRKFEGSASLQQPSTQNVSEFVSKPLFPRGASSEVPCARFPATQAAHLFVLGGRVLLDKVVIRLRFEVSAGQTARTNQRTSKLRKACKSFLFQWRFACDPGGHQSQSFLAPVSAPFQYAFWPVVDQPSRWAFRRGGSMNVVKSSEFQTIEARSPALPALEDKKHTARRTSSSTAINFGGQELTIGLVLKIWLIFCNKLCVLQTV